MNQSIRTEGDKKLKFYVRHGTALNFTFLISKLTRYKLNNKNLKIDILVRLNHSRIAKKKEC